MKPMAFMNDPPSSPPSLIPIFFNASPMAIRMSSVMLCIIVLLPLVLLHFYLDYNKFLSLGPGGTPQTVRGYLKLKVLSIFALRNPHQPPRIPLCLVTRTGYLHAGKSLPLRLGSRPHTAGIAPHRQMTQQSSEAIYEQLSHSIEKAAFQTQELQLGTSCFEQHSTGLFCIDPQRRTCGGEICHTHPSDGSMHLTLHPADAKVLLEAGWGERHPLAGGGWLERFVPSGFVLVYAPRTVEEVDVVMEIVKAAAWWVAGKEVKASKQSSISGLNFYTGASTNTACPERTLVLETN